MNKNRDGKGMPLSVIAIKLGINKSRLQYYKEMGIIYPISCFPESKQFIYDLREIKVILKKIKENKKKTGLTLTEMMKKAII